MAALLRDGVPAMGVDKILDGLLGLLRTIGGTIVR